MSTARDSGLKKNGVYMFRNLASGKYLNIYGNDQVGNNRNVCQWEASADLSQLWRLYQNEADNMKIVSIISDSAGNLYSLNVYRTVHKNTDIYTESVLNDLDSAIEIESVGNVQEGALSGVQVRIRLHYAERDGNHLYLTAVGSSNGSSATTSTSGGNVIWKAGDENNSQQIWVAEYFTDYPTEKFDLRKFGAQIFLRKMYASNIAIDAKSSTHLCRELIRALQIELGITLGANESYGNFGPKTADLCPTLYKGCSVKPAIIKILCHALFCKGYSTSSIYDEFNDNVESGVIDVQYDIGMESTGIVTPTLFKAILNTDGYHLALNGDSHIYKMQRNLNRNYWDYSGIYSCDGIFSRDTNKAIIYALQKEIGIAANAATGTFGPSTTALCPTLPLAQGSSLDEQNLVKILQYGLYINGYNKEGVFDGIFSDSLLNDVQSFQRFMVYTVKNVADMDTIKGLLTSCGNTNRPAAACDTATILNANSASILYNAGYRYVGRYLTGTVRTSDGLRITKALTVVEAQAILDAGLSIIPIYQDGGTYPDYFNRQRGTVDAGAAISAALALGLPRNATIYFAVDCDVYGYQVESLVANYFSAISDYFESYNATQTDIPYNVGVYGPRYTCTYICSHNYAKFCYVSDMSTGYSGNLGYKMPENWSFDQFAETNVQNINIDKVAVSGRDAGIAILSTGATGITEEQKKYAILHKACDFQEDIELLRSVSVPSISLGVPVTIFKIPSMEAKLTVSESITSDGSTPIFTFSVSSGNISTSQKAEFDNGFKAAVSADTNLADYLKESDLDEIWKILKGMGVSLQNGNITVSYNITEKSLTWSVCASTDKLSLPMNNHCSFSLTLSLIITLDEDGGISDSSGALSSSWKRLEFNTVALQSVAAVALGGLLIVLAVLVYQSGFLNAILSVILSLL